MGSKTRGEESREGWGGGGKGKMGGRGCCLHTKPDLDVEKVEMGVANNTQSKRVRGKNLNKSSRF